jgi:hypothetical protein
MPGQHRQSVFQIRSRKARRRSLFDFIERAFAVEQRRDVMKKVSEPTSRHAKPAATGSEDKTFLIPSFRAFQTDIEITPEPGFDELILGHQTS